METCCDVVRNPLGLKNASIPFAPPDRGNLPLVVWGRWSNNYLTSNL